MEEKSPDTSVSCMLHVQMLFQNITNRLNYTTLTKKQFISKIHKFILHISLNFCNYMNSFLIEFLPTFWINHIPFVTKKFSHDIFSYFKKSKFTVISNVP